MSLSELIAGCAQPGRIEWIGLRPQRRAGMQVVEAAMILTDGIEGDRARAGKRAVTLIQRVQLAGIWGEERWHPMCCGAIWWSRGSICRRLRGERCRWDKRYCGSPAFARRAAGWRRRWARAGILRCADMAAGVLRF